MSTTIQIHEVTNIEISPIREIEDKGIKRLGIVLVPLYARNITLVTRHGPTSITIYADRYSALEILDTLQK